ncbi:hypothetical protein ACIRU8_39765 [Streptomyces sp. NPDC101175]|uniref:hypothetical protein n=1 Tax=Streptomyces sp. NPDC101175 TaxID=3366123 RepID=UPI003836B851
MTTCRTCHQDYDETDEEAVKRHTEPVDCEQSCRCRSKPRCYICHGSFCVCNSH